MSPNFISTLVWSATIFTTVLAGPCDIYASGGTPCVAAFGTTRALYNSFNGGLYQIKRNSDGATTDVAPLSQGGVANAAYQDSFCANTTCIISVIYDQSGRGNHLRQAPPGSGSKGPEPGQYDALAAADGAPVTLNGQKAYGVFVMSTVGYRNDQTNGVATGNDPEGMYAIFDGTHYNGMRLNPTSVQYMTSPIATTTDTPTDKCCFDFGNAETDNIAGADGTMEALYFGSNTYYQHGSGNTGPWIEADMENGLYAGGNGNNANSPPQTSRFLSAFLKGDSSNLWAIKGGNSTSGPLSTYWNGQRPSGYYPMKKQGAVLLGIGGDNGNLDQGTFYEGVLTTGYPSDNTENQVQANIVNARYATTPLTTGPAITVGSTVTFKATTPGFTNRYLAHSGDTVNTQVISSSSNSTSQQLGQWKVRSGLSHPDAKCLSFESVDTPGSYIRHYGFNLKLNSPDGSAQFNEDATFCPQKSFNSAGTNSLRSWSYPTRYFRHYGNVGYAASNGGPNSFDASSSFNDDASWVVGTRFQ